MSEAQVCPICTGTGQIPEKKGQGQYWGRYGKVICHGCNGKGWVEVRNER